MCAADLVLVFCSSARSRSCPARLVHCALFQLVPWEVGGPFLLIPSYEAHSGHWSSGYKEAFSEIFFVKDQKRKSARRNDLKGMRLNHRRGSKLEWTLVCVKRSAPSGYSNLMSKSSLCVDQSGGARFGWFFYTSNRIAKFKRQ